jgi:hypothetical protein
VLINAVLNAIPIFYLSFLKMPKSVAKKVVRIQREFLWGGVKGGQKICWVKWSVVCRGKKQGGLVGDSYNPGHPFGRRFWWQSMETSFFIM